MRDSDRPRVALIGARRGRQGLGPHLARQFQAHGAEVVGFLGTSDATVAQATEQLLAQGVSATGTTDLEALLGTEKLDALVIASPARHHEPYLERALTAGLHVFCEKPLVWDGEDASAQAASLERRFAEAQLVLFENVQWPLTLAAFEALHPAARAARPRSFTMHLGPTSRGRAMLVDALSHPLSLAQALLRGPPPAVHEPLRALEFSTLDPDTETLRVSFVMPVTDGELDVVVRLTTSPRQPRPAGYAVDGFSAERRVRMEDYALFLEDGERRVALPDPMDALVGKFVAALRGDANADGNGPWNRGLGQRLAWLEQLVQAFDAGTKGA